MSENLGKLPVRLRVGELVSSRYSNGNRPLNWDQRVSGEDLIKTDDGRVVKLQSDGGQSPPKKDWEILITGGDAQTGYGWTLYAIK